MDQKQIISELDSIISYCDLLKEKATGLRRKLMPVQVSASRKRAVTPEAMAKVLADRQKFRNKKPPGSNAGNE
jgi:hypothetical protein